MEVSPEQLQIIYREIHAKLIQPFPLGTVEMRDKDSNSRFIPVQPYIHRLEESAGTYWSWRLTGEPTIFDKEGQVMVRGILRVVEAEREGVGFANIQRFDDTGKIKNLKYAINSATSDALRDACNLYEMGWKDLAPYRKWAQNPGTGLGGRAVTSTSEIGGDSSIPKCVKCQKSLTTEDVAVLREFNVKHPYCQEHLPNHLRK